MLAFLASIGARLLPVRAFFSAVPRWVWIALGIALCVAAGAFWHGHKVKAYGAAQYAAGEQAAYANVAKQARELAGKANALNRSLADKIRSRTDEALADNARAADRLRVRGPGAARCTAVAGLSSAAGGPQSSSRPGDAPVAGLRDEERTDLIALPAAPTFDFAEQHDNFRTEALAWREYWRTFNARWQAWKKEAAATSPPPNAPAPASR